MRGAKERQVGVGVIKLRLNPVRYHFLCFITRSSPRSERSPTRGLGESFDWTPDHPLESFKTDSGKYTVGGRPKDSHPQSVYMEFDTRLLSQET